jgi:hypothetical protein
LRASLEGLNAPAVVDVEDLPLFDEDSGPLFNWDKLQAVSGTNARISKTLFHLGLSLSLITSSILP